MGYHFNILLALLCGNALTVLGQVSYVGTVGGAAVELALNDPAEGPVEGVYFYPKFGTPIGLSGQLKRGQLVLTEKDARGKPAATFTVPTFGAGAGRLAGTWRSLATGKSLPVVLTATDSHEILQINSLNNNYFKLVLDDQSAGPFGHVVAVKILAKKTNQLVQQLAVDCESRGTHSVEVGDYNFDGLPDFSVFESSYAGPNTSSLYFLYDPATRQFADSGFAGISLEFDAKKKRVYERNSCCAGTSVTTAEYKVVDNELVVIAQHCYRWDEKKQALVERKLSACQ